MKKVALLLLLLAACPTVAAQAIIQGRVTDRDGNPIAWSGIRLLAMPDSALVAYAYADEAGAFSLQAAKAGAYRLRIDALAFQALEQEVLVPATAVPATLRIHAKLAAAPMELDEVVVRAEPAVRNGKDTVEIRASAFSTGSERVAEDLLRRLPGIEVGADGSIRVRGKAVSKVLIEGDDLFDKGYTLLTKNLSAGVIDRVEVLKRYTDNPVLRGLEQSEALALNLRLKEEVKGELFGKGFVGGGPGAYETDLNLIQVRRRNKAFFLGNLNNAGKDATGDLQALLSPKNPAETAAAADDQQLFSLLPQLPLQTGLPEMRSRSNNAELASLSGVFSPGGALKIKGHFFYSADEQTQRSQSREVFRTDSLAFDNAESAWARRSLPLQSGRFSVLHSTQKQQWEWVSELQTSQHRLRRELLFNGEPVSEDSREQALQARSHFSLTRRIDSATALQASLYYGFNRKPLRMRLAGVDWGDLTPTGAGELFFSRVSNSLSSWGGEASLLRGKGRWLGRLMAGYAFRQAILESDFEAQAEGGDPLSGPEFRNQGRNGQGRLQGGVQVTYAGTALTLRGRLLGQYLTNRFQDVTTTHDKRFALVPALSCNWQAGRAHFFVGSYTYGFRETALQEHYGGYLPGGFRLLQRGLGEFQAFRTHRWLLSYTLGEWGDPHLLTSTFLYSREPEYAGSESQVGPGLVLASAQRLAGRDNFSWNGSYDQYLKGLRSNLKLKAELQVQQYESRFNGLSQQNELVNLQAGPELRTVFDGGFNAHGGLRWGLSRYSGSTRSLSRSQTGFLDLEFHSGPWMAELSNEGYRYRDAGLGRTVWFSDLGVRYAPKGAGTTWRVHLANIWNTRTLDILNLTETGRYENRVALRPRQLVIGLDFRF